MARKGLGKGLDSLIPDIFDEDFDSNTAQSLEEIMKGKEDETVKDIVDDIESKNKSGEVKDEPVEEEPVEEEIEETNDDEEDDANDDEDSEDSTDEVQPEVPEEPEEEEEVKEGNDSSEDLSGDSDSEETVQTPQKIQVNDEHVDEVKEIVDKNPRITLWSARSSAVFRYLRKTEPEFSISKEASVLIEEAVAKKYPEIWELFEDL